ncbi:hypothetical protein [Xenorhabdus griffiniae]|uniref:Uncharacterized protein n=1 Tax=Xenorhabdus griffiniae TaxID=351672 RepID=A0ABY9XDH9_9GAMM|nr:hypothetical protein [Xenorhabdus griffiniae]MBD1229509.1 hypothetical protein [Xenorhabdus griffiniae]MBE8589325.1 hypothetical protein [Xenorhabdus griffiniae]WMV70971.1 hypothetical protein QL128_12245 [Xenorhabdus griffiniae]WMV71672.1 hypothetical protein QL128_16250 [Xenorhabdus griffiniae]WNH00647.1 hypothetical protein QL112_012250 [Xenorhabdus griffiniae]
MSQFHQAAYNTLRQSIRMFERAGVSSLCVPIAISNLRAQYPHVFGGTYHRTNTLLNELGFVSRNVDSLIADGASLQLRTIAGRSQRILTLLPHRCDISQRIYEQAILPYIVNGLNGVSVDFATIVQLQYSDIVAAGVMTYLRRSGNYNF